MSRLGKNTCRLFSDNSNTDGKCWRDYMAERSRKREAQVRFLVASQEAIAQKQRLANLVAVFEDSGECPWNYM